MDTTVENEFAVEDLDAGLRLDQALARRFPRLNRNEWQLRIRAGDVIVNNSPARPSRRLQAGDRVRYRFVRAAEPDVSRNYSIVYEDEYLYVVDKPGDLPVHPSGVYRENTLYSLIKAERGADFPVHLVHRLDRETSGLLMIARDGQTARELQNAFQHKADAPNSASSVRKLYQTIVECPGEFPEELEARGWLFAAGDGPVRKKRSFSVDRPAQPAATTQEPPRTALTRFRRLQNKAGLALVEAQLFTGRMHQIRATLCSLGYPVVGDRLYGVDESLYLKMIADEETPADRARLRMNRTALHAARLELQHPRTGAPLVLESPLPADMRELFFESE